MTRTEYNKAVAQYLASLPSANKSANTARAYKGTLMEFGTWLAEQNSGAATEQIDRLTVVAWRSSLSEQNSTNTVRDKMIRLHRFFSWAVKMGVCADNPVDGEEIPKKKQVEYNLLNFEEIQRIFEGKTKGSGLHNAVRNRAILLLLCMAGLRNSELRHLRLSDLNFESGTILVRHGKGDKNRTVAFPKMCRTAVNAYLASGERPESAGADGLLFGTEADEQGHRASGRTEWHEISSQALLGMVNRYTEKCCGHAVCVHALRHAAVSLWDHLNVPPSEMQQALGHSSITTTMGIYRHILQKEKAAHSINAALDSM